MKLLALGISTRFGEDLEGHRLGAAATGDYLGLWAQR
jgi:hypothetical protein